MRRVVSEARGLTALPALNGSLRLRTLRADRARLAHLPAALCAHAPQLRTLYVPAKAPSPHLARPCSAARLLQGPEAEPAAARARAARLRRAARAVSTRALPRPSRRRVSRYERCRVSAGICRRMRSQRCLRRRRATTGRRRSRRCWGWASSRICCWRTTACAACRDMPSGTTPTCSCCETLLSPHERFAL